MNAEAKRLVLELGLQPHPEGGYFRQTYRSSIEVGAPSATRSAMTLIYYLLSDENFSAFHRLASDEVWHHYRGAPVAIEVIDADGRHRQLLIGDGRCWQAIIPAGAWFAAYVTEPGEFALVGCDVAPGFEFEEFELGSRAALARMFPQHKDLTERWTRTSPVA